MDSVDSDNVVSIAKWQEKKQEEVKFIVDELGLEKLIDDLTNIHANFRETFDLEDEPTYGDWCRLQQTLNIFEDMMEHIWYNHATQSRPELFDLASQLKSTVKNMMHFVEDNKYDPT
jgi:hypothetical protein